MTAPKNKYERDVAVDAVAHDIVATRAHGILPWRDTPHGWNPTRHTTTRHTTTRHDTTRGRRITLVLSAHKDAPVDAGAPGTTRRVPYKVGTFLQISLSDVHLDRDAKIIAIAKVAAVQDEPVRLRPINLSGGCMYPKSYQHHTVCRS